MTRPLTALLALCALAAPAFAQSRQSPPEPPPARDPVRPEGIPAGVIGGVPGAVARPPAPAPAVVTEVGGETAWYTVVPEGDRFSVSMPVTPTVQAVREIGGGFSVVYTAVGEDLVCMVLSTTMGAGPAKANAELSAEAFTMVGLEMIAAGMKPQGFEPAVRYVRAVSQGGLVGGEGTLTAGGAALYGRARVFRKDGQAFMLVAMASTPLTASDRSERFLSSFSLATDEASRAALKLGTTVLTRPKRPETSAVSSSDVAPPVEWRRLAPEGESFSVTMPPLVEGQIAKELQRRAAGLPDMAQYVGMDGTTLFMVVSSPLSGLQALRPADTRTMVLDTLRGINRGMARYEAAGEPRFEKEVTVGGVTGGQGRIDMTGVNGYVVARVFQTKARFYVVGVVVYDDSVGEEKVNRFLDSFAFDRAVR